MNMHFHSAVQPGILDAEVADLLGKLSEQAEHWHTSLTHAQSQIRALSESEDLRRCREQGCSSLLDRHQAALLVEDMLTRGAQRIAYVRPGDTSFLDKEETRAAFRAHPRVCAQELVSRPKRIPCAGSERSRILVRTTWTELDEIAIIDETVALVPSPRADGSAEIAVVQQPLMVRQLSKFFNAAWVQAVGEPGPAPARGEADADVKQRIIFLLAEGAKDEAVARRLGISLRTCRRHVAEILDQLGSSSRFQAGVRAALLGALPVRPPASSL